LRVQLADWQITSLLAAWVVVHQRHPLGLSYFELPGLEILGDLHAMARTFIGVA